MDSRSSLTEKLRKRNRLEGESSFPAEVPLIKLIEQLICSESSKISAFVPQKHHTSMRSDERD